MRLIFLGTGHGDPEPDMHFSSALIETGGALYLIDAGAPVGPLMRRLGMDINNIRGIFITHMHGDHVFGLPELAYFLSGAVADEMPRTQILLPSQRGVDVLNAYVAVMKCRDDAGADLISLYSKGVIYSDDCLRLTAFPSRHLPSDSYSFLVEAEGKRIVFTGDMADDFPDFPIAAMDRDTPCDLVVCEAAHCILAEKMTMLKSVQTKRMIFNHIAPARNGRAFFLLSTLPFDSEPALEGREYTV
jgi:ribonuclease Z